MQATPRSARVLADGRKLKTSPSVDGLVVNLTGPRPPDVNVLMMKFKSPISVTQSALTTPEADETPSLHPMDADNHGSRDGNINAYGAAAIFDHWLSSGWRVDYLLKTPAARTWPVTANVAALAAGPGRTWKTVELKSVHLAPLPSRKPQGEPLAKRLVRPRPRGAPLRPMQSLRRLVTCLLFACLPDLLAAAEAEPRIWRVLAAGDSITEGGSTFSNWRYQLWEKLTAAGYYIEYVGSREAPSRIGNLRHEGYGGKNVEFLAERLSEKFPSPAPDFLLLHTGHNHFAEEKPIPGMLAALERIIASARAANPRVTILLAQVITSLKLPKYSYLPEFNAALPAFAARLTTAASPIVIVDHATGFDPAVDTVADQVHPSASGAAKMAERWFEALVKLLPSPAEPAPLPHLVPYKTVGSRSLDLHVFSPAPGPGAAPRPAIVFFYGGGWSRGTPIQYYRECRHFASRGYVAIAADYRTSAFSSKNTPFDSVADARSALRYLRAHAAELGIDPARIIASGASAGGHLAAATALLSGIDDPADDLSVSPRPAALVLWYPVIDNGPGGYGHERIGSRYKDFSPLHNISATPPPPPTLVFLGTADQLIPVATGQDFQKRLQAAGALCDLRLFPGLGHPIYDYRNPAAAKLRAECLAATDSFLRSLHFPKTPHP